MSFKRAAVAVFSPDATATSSGRQTSIEFKPALTTVENVFWSSVAGIGTRQVVDRRGGTIETQ
jgi:hypothetical protein